MLDCPRRQGLAQFALGPTRLQTSIHAASLVSRDDHPGFGFALFARHKEVCLRIIRMHLQRKSIAGIQKLDEQGELRDPGMPPQQFRRSLAYEPLQRPTVVIPASDERLVCPMVADFPAFGIVTFCADWFSK